MRITRIRSVDGTVWHIPNGEIRRVGNQSQQWSRDLIDVQWFQTAATLNPVSYMLEAVRSLIIEGWDAQALALGFGFTIVLGLISVPLAGHALRTRMTRT